MLLPPQSALGQTLLSDTPELSKCSAAPAAPARLPVEVACSQPRYLEGKAPTAKLRDAFNAPEVAEALQSWQGSHPLQLLQLSLY